jgi:hypothetical protein
MAKLIRTDGVEVEVTPKDTKRGFTLEELYNLIGFGCDIVEVVTLADGKTLMVMDEEGKYRVPVFWNEKATKLLAKAGGLPGDVVAGVVVLCSEKEFQ